MTTIDYVYLAKSVLLKAVGRNSEDGVTAVSSAVSSAVISAVSSAVISAVSSAVLSAVSSAVLSAVSSAVSSAVCRISGDGVTAVSSKSSSGVWIEITLTFLQICTIHNRRDYYSKNQYLIFLHILNVF